MAIARRKDELRPRKRPVQARSRRTVDVVLRAAAQVFAKRGYAAGTTNHIAERAGVSIGTLYEYFPNKDAILVALMERHIRDGEAVLEAAAAELAAAPRDLAGSVRHFVRAMVDFHAQDRALHRVLFEEAPLPPRVRHMLADLERRIAERVEGMLVGDPTVTVRDTRLAAVVLVQTVEALTHKLVVHGERETDLDEFVDEIVRLVERYLTATP